MKVMIKEIINKKEKETISREILYDLPEWFGISESTENYIKNSQEKLFIASFIEDKPVGFIVLNSTSKDCSEIFVMGVKKEFHRMKIGYELNRAYEIEAKKLGYTYSQVKTVCTGIYKEYDITNSFYLSLGYKELECFPNLWNEENPCQIYIKYLER